MPTAQQQQQMLAKAQDEELKRRQSQTIKTSTAGLSNYSPTTSAGKGLFGFGASSQTLLGDE